MNDRRPSGELLGFKPEIAERAKDRFPELYRSAVTSRATFDAILQARRIRQRAEESGDWHASQYLEALLRDSFEAEHGRITNTFWCEVAYGGGLVTERGYLNSSLKSRDEELMTIEFSIKQVARDAQRTFASEVAKIVKNNPADAAALEQATLPEISAMLFSALSRVLDAADVLEDRTSEPAMRNAAMAATRAEWQLARHRVDVLIQRQASWEYFMGVLAGAPVAIAMFAVLGAIASQLWSQSVSVASFVAATVCGSLGAVVSVTQRISAGRLRIDYTASRAKKVILGAWRPFLGGTLGGILQFAILGGLLTVQGSQPSPQTPATFAFYALIGFAGGFSERLATDLLERAGQMIVPSRSTDTGNGDAAPDGAAVGPLPPKRAGSTAGDGASQP